MISQILNNTFWVAQFLMKGFTSPEANDSSFVGFWNMPTNYKPPCTLQREVCVRHLPFINKALLHLLKTKNRDITAILTRKTATIHKKFEIYLKSSCIIFCPKRVQYSQYILFTKRIDTNCSGVIETSWNQKITQTFSTIWSYLSQNVSIPPNHILSAYTKSIFINSQLHQ